MIQKKLPIARPDLGSEEIRQVSRVISSGWVTQGPEVERFEDEFSKFTQSRYALALSNCTSALHLALKAVGVSKNDEVITVSHSYIATANSIRYCNAIPVFVDIEPETYNINPNLIELAISKKTKAILCVHQMGMPCNLEKIIKIAKKYTIPIIEDAACAIGSEIHYKENWEPIGQSHGDIVCFSFHPRKVITTGDGGMITTNNRDYYHKIRLWREHSISISSKDRHNTKEVLFEEHLDLGYNYRMTDVQAAIGRVQLRKIKELIKKRQKISKNYFELLNNINGIKLPFQHKWAKSNWQSFCIRLSSKINQKQIMNDLMNFGISTKRGIMCAHLEPAYIKEKWNTGLGVKDLEKLQESKKATNHSILIPIFPSLLESEQIFIVNNLIKLINKY